MKKSLAGKAWEVVRTFATRTIRFEFEGIPTSIPRASYARIANWLLVELSVMAKSRTPWGWPTHVHIEASSRCNQRCQYCPVGQDLSGETGHLGLEHFKRFVDDVGRYPLLFEMWGWGEPFLNPDTYEMIAYARRKGIRTVSSTNGQVFANMENAEKLVRSGLDILIVAVSGITQETYGHLRRGSSVDLVFRGIRNIAEQKRLQDSATPVISYTYIVNRHNQHEVDQVREVAASLGADAVSLKRLNPTSTRTENWHGDEHISDDERFVRLRYDGEERRRVKNNPCKALWQGSILRWNGTINACAYDFHGDYPLGDLVKTNFRKIWTGEAYRQMRARFRKDWNEISICHNCTYAFEGGNYDEIIAETIFLGEEEKRAALRASHNSAESV
jgi:radical SAM protein with 4Fe4S-binding SPASM domain